MNNTVIEEETIDLVKLFSSVSTEARREKLGNAKPPINEIHYWWTRKPLIVGRAVVLASTLDNINVISSLLGLSRDKPAFNFKPNLEVYAKQIKKNPKEINVLDPFAGAGNLIFEAKELGLNCVAMDYNPLAYLIMNGSLYFPTKYGQRLVEDVEKFGYEVIDRCRKELHPYFDRAENKALAYVWMWCMRCPYCNQRFPLTNNMWLARGKGRRTGVKFLVNKNHDFSVHIDYNLSLKEGNSFTQKNGKAICIRCRNSIDREQITKAISKFKDRELIAIVTKVKGGKYYELPTPEGLC